MPRITSRPAPPIAVRFLLGLALSVIARAAESAPPVELVERSDSVILRNGRIETVISKGGSNITSIKFGEHQMVSPGKPVYYSMGGGKSYRQPSGGIYRIVKRTPDLVDIAFLQKWKPGAPQAVDIEVHYALKRGEAGVYTYGILIHPADYPDTAIGEWRMVWGMPPKNDREWLMEKIRVDAPRAWEMPSPADLATAKPTGIKEIVEITRGPRAGKFDCKYDFNLEYYSTGCWGHASDKNQVGAWIVLGSHEFFNDGPTKQDLSSASGIIHIHFGRNHYGGSSTQIAAGEEWKKIYGPFLLYCNQGGNADALWADARAKAAAERKAWPYDWVDDTVLYPPRAARGTVRGHLAIRDALKPALNSAGAWVGLSQPAPGGNWQFESNHYQYWTKADAAGNFEIPNVRPGTYTLSAFTNGAVGEFEMRGAVMKPGINPAGDLEWDVPRIGKSIAWEIGVPDRSAAEFRHGDDYFHGYVWKNFSKEWRNPLVYTIGQSSPAHDWNYAQGSYIRNGDCERWPWEIRFRLGSAPEKGTARLILAWASADSARVSVAINGKDVASISPAVEGGNALLREGIHAKYCFNYVDFPSANLKTGNNTITLTHTRTTGSACHVMYDYVALETP
jgi:rhamnogalacturonan endolyase